ncbi:MAG: type I DNA topoisomerase, partial [Victivallales bacterium]|nr:type I DNA topoisomerase [Victivallales bacterium]
PTKAKTITRFLGNAAQVMASQGHVRDLPEHALGVEIENDFKPDYELTANGKKVVNQLKQAAKGAADIYLATDPDREGEAIAWHLQEVLKPASKAQFHRITFHEITKSAIQKSFAQPGVIDLNMVDAQQARRVLDRIVGYQVSPLLWRSIHGATSAGRVQTVALRLVVEREREIAAFVPVESWNLDAKFETTAPQSSFKARLAKVNGNNIRIPNGELAGMIADALQSQGVTHKISKVTSTPRTKNPPPPFITSTLQQASGSNLGLGASQTMRIAQELYEGIDLGSGQVGLITYMRTDSFNVAKEAQDQALKLIEQKFGPAYVPAKPNHYRAGKNAQEAHEAIRPTDMQYSPEAIGRYLTPQQLKVYTLIWNRFLASQMAPARQMDHLIEVESKGGALVGINQEKFIANPEKLPPAADGVVCQFRATSRETIFPGFLMAYKFREVGEEDDEGMAANLPSLPVGTDCEMSELKREQCFSQPPPRYSEASLVKALEQNGVGRPSTYATTVNTIQERSYVSKSSGTLKPTELGFKVCDFLLGRIETLFEVKFTADMEDKLDHIEEGTENWVDMIRDFYGKF